MLYLVCLGGILLSIYTLMYPEDFIRHGWFVDGEPVLWIKVLTRIIATIGLICSIFALIAVMFP